MKVFGYFIALAVLTAAILLGIQSLLFGKEKSRFAAQPDGIDRTMLNINRFSQWVYANGLSAHIPDVGQGAFYPRGTAGVIYQDGLVWGGKVIDGQTPIIRAGGTQWVVGHVAGAIISPGVAEDKNDPQVNRVWRVRRDYQVADLRRDTAELLEKPQEDVTPGEILATRERYRQDWLNWPWQKGAPFYDAEGDGIYSPGFGSDGAPVLFPLADEPGVADADQVIWLIVNDLDPVAVFDFAGSPPIGIEMQVTLWGYDRDDALGHVIFRRHRLIYKGDRNTAATARVDSMYVVQWGDPDLGFVGDDLAGCDIGLALGYVYNGRPGDSEFEPFDLPPPAVGYDIALGPLVASPGGRSLFDFRVRAGFENLPMTGFTYVGSGDAGVAFDPSVSNYNGTQMWWNLFRGFRPLPVSPPFPIIDPATGLPTRFLASGDPISQTGFVDSGSGDRRMQLISGPFKMALGDTNEVTVALIGGLGSDRLMSISALKHRSRLVQQFVDNLFLAPKPPPAPQISASEFDGQILLNWGDNPDRVAQIEAVKRSGFRFEGYNIYQLPAAGASLGDGVKLRTFDLDNGIRAILQPEFDPANGIVVQTVVQRGEDSGVFRTLTVDRDLLHDQPLFSGQEYHFAVTSYNYNPEPLAGVRSLESTSAVVTVRPQGRAPGQRLHGSAGDTLFATHFGSSDGEVMALVVDPTRLTGDDYEVVFSKDSSGVGVWQLLNSTRGDTLLRNQINQSGNENYLITEGFMTVVVGPPNGFKKFSMVANAAGPIVPPTGGAADFRNFPVPSRPGSLQQVGSGIWFFNVGGGANDGTYATFLSRSLRNDNFSRVIPFDWEMRFTRDSWAVRAFEDDALLKLPFSLWNIGSNTPDDPSDDYRLIPWFLSNGGVGGLQTDPNGMSYQLDPNDSGASGGSNDPYTPWVYWRIPADTSPGEAGYNAFISAIDTSVAFQPGVDGSGSYDFASPEAFARTILVSWNGDDVSDGEVAPGTQLHPEEGSIIRITTAKPNTPADRFTFSTSGFAPTQSLAQARADVVKLVNVFPNPYYGIFRFETRFASGFVTFSHLPDKATIRIFTLAGSLVSRLEKSGGDQFLRWDLKNHDDRLVASGIYVAYVEMPELGVSKVLKLAVVQ